MPCADCYQLKQEFQAQKEFMAHWFDLFFKQMQSLESQTYNFRQSVEAQSSEFRTEITSKLDSFELLLANSHLEDAREFQMGLEAGISGQPTSGRAAEGLGYVQQNAIRNSVPHLPNENGLISFEPANHGRSQASGQNAGSLAPAKKKTWQWRAISRAKNDSNRRDLERYECSVCKKKFGRKDYLNKHMIVHSGKKPFACSECPQSFLQRGDLNKHVLIHSGEKPYVCDICGRPFTHPSNLRKHRFIHSEERPFHCPVPDCGYRTKTPAELRQHAVTHSTARPFECPECGRKFARKSVLVSHRKSGVHEREKRDLLINWKRKSKKSYVRDHS